jgi:nucleoside-diphosphate-sugar epimerase
MRVLITGAAGFLGSHLADRYLREGWEVVGVDNFSTGKRDNLTAASRMRTFFPVTCDVAAEKPTFADLLATFGGFDLILHFASAASPRHYDKHPIETIHANTAGTDVCCKLAATSGARLLFASTSEVYGDPLVHPQPESYWGNVNCAGARSCYDESKRCGEALVMAYARKRGVDVRVVRIFNTYGPRMDARDGRLIPNFLDQARNAKPLTIYGDGSQTRSLCYVDDLIDGIICAAAAPDARGEIVNLGNPREMAVIDIARVVCNTVGVPERFTYRPLPPDDPRRRCPDISKARSLLGWEPHVALDEGLRKTLDALRPGPLFGVAHDELSHLGSARLAQGK